MERGGNSFNEVLKQVFRSLVMLLLGFLFGLSLARMVYISCLTAFGRVNFCSLWIDVSGRFSILAACYYLAGLCGFLPLSSRLRSSSIMTPFRIWSRDCWRRLFRNLFSPTPAYNLMVNFQRNAIPVREGLEMPLSQPTNQSSPLRRRTSATVPVKITFPDSRVAPNREVSSRSTSPEINKSSSESFLSTEFPMSGIPPLKGKSSKPHHLSEVSQESSSQTPVERERASSEYHKRYTKTKWTGEEAAKALMPVPNDRACRKEEKLDVTRQRARSRPVNEMSKVPATDERVGKSTAKDPSRTRKGNQATATNEQETSRQLLNTEAQVNFPGTSSRNRQQTGDATASRDVPGTSGGIRNTETELDFPRFPWCYLRHPGGVPKGVTKLHDRNLKLEKRLSEKYMARQTGRVSLDRIISRIVTDNLRNERVTETQPPGNSRNINEILKNFLETFNRSTTAAAESSKSGEPTATSSVSAQVINKDYVDHPTKNQTDPPQRQETEIPNKDLAENRPLIFSQRSEQTQKQEAENASDGRIRCRQLPSQRFQSKTKIRSQTEKTDVRREAQRRKDSEDADQRTFFEPGPSNLFSFKRDTERTCSILGPGIEKEKPANESLKIECSTEKLSQFRQSTQIEATETFTTLQSVQNIDAGETEIQTTNLSGRRDGADSDAITKSNDRNKTTKPDIEITLPPEINESEDDRDSDAELIGK